MFNLPSNCVKDKLEEECDALSRATLIRVCDADATQLGNVSRTSMLSLVTVAVSRGVRRTLLLVIDSCGGDVQGMGN